MPSMPMSIMTSILIESLTFIPTVLQHIRSHSLLKRSYKKVKYSYDLEDGTQKRIGITQAHLEADAGKNIHEGDHSKVDLNRAGTPLLRSSLTRI